MMTSRSDYRILTVPSTIDVSGDILPVADEEGRDARLRMEDVYYLYEMYNSFRNYNMLQTPSTSNDSFTICNEIRAIYNYCHNLSAIVSARTGHADIHLSGNVELYDGGIVNQDNRNKFWRWLETGGYYKKLTNTSTQPEVYSDDVIRGENVRALYNFLNDKFFWRLSTPSDTLGSIPIFRFDMTPVSYSIPWLTKDSSGNPVIGSLTYSTSQTNVGISIGDSTNGKNTGVQVIYKGPRSARQYYHVKSLPTTVVQPVVLPFEADAVYALVETTAMSDDYSYTRYHERLVPLTGSGKNWNLALFDSTVATNILSAAGVQVFDQWVSSTHAPNYYTESAVLFAKFNNIYFHI